MRILVRFGREVEIAGKKYLASVRPLNASSGQLRMKNWGEDTGETLRLLLPYDAVVPLREKITLDGGTYACVFVRTLHGHVQADFKRCAG